MAYTLYTQSFGLNNPNSAVIINEAATGTPATILSSATGGVLSTSGMTKTDASGNISVYIDTARTWVATVVDEAYQSTTSISLNRVLSSAELASTVGQPGIVYISTPPGSAVSPYTPYYWDGTAMVPELTKAQTSSTIALVLRAGNTPTPAPIPGISESTLGQITAIAGSPTLTLTTGPNGKQALKVEWAQNSLCELSLVPLISSYFHGDAVVLLDSSYTRGNLAFASIYASQDDATYAIGIVQALSYGYPTPQDSAFEQGGAVSYWFRKSAHSNFGVPTYPFLVGATKLRLSSNNNGAGLAYIYGVAFTAPKVKSRICVMWDDGYDSMFKLGQDSFASRNIKQTMGIIGSAQDYGGSYSYWRQQRAFVDGGNAIVAHGPWPNQGIGNLWSAYNGTGDVNAVVNALADMQRNRDSINAQGLLLPGAEKCYVWPQGTFQRFANDTALLDAALAAGFTTARGVSNLAGASIYSNSGVRFDALSKYGRMALPIFGHLWAGTTAAETTNITAITTAISGLAAAKGDACLMLHRVLPSNTNDAGMGAAGNITIRKADLETIAAAIKTQIDAGTMEAVTMPEISLPTWWAQ